MSSLLVIIVSMYGTPIKTEVYDFGSEPACAYALSKMHSGDNPWSEGAAKLGADVHASCNSLHTLSGKAKR